MALPISAMFRRIQNLSALPNAFGIAPRPHYHNCSLSDGMRNTLGRRHHSSCLVLVAHRRFVHHEIIRASFPMISALSRYSFASKSRLESSALNLHGSNGMNFYHRMVQRNIHQSLGVAKFSTAAASNSTTSAKSEKTKSSDGNVFLDNIGTIFLLFIASLITWMVRGYYNGVRRNTVREKQIESMAHADPIELDDLRVANAPEFNLETFQYIQQYILDQKLNASVPDESNHLMINGNSNSSADGHSPSSTVMMAYPEFVSLVRTAMIQMKGEAFTIQLGHILDRVVVAALEKQRRKATDVRSDTPHDQISDSNVEQSTNILDATPMPLEFWLTVLSLAMAGTPFERIQALHSVFRSSSSYNSSDASLTISIDQVVQLVGYLQDTCQLVPDAQVVMTSHKYPLQEYVVANPEQLVDREQWDNSDSKGSKDVPDCANNITVNMLTEILSSRSVCAWGECYRYKTK